VADHRAFAVVEVEHRREAEVDAVGTQLGRQDVAAGGGGRNSDMDDDIPF